MTAFLAFTGGVFWLAFFGVWMCVAAFTLWAKYTNLRERKRFAAEWRAHCAKWDVYQPKPPFPAPPGMGYLDRQQRDDALRSLGVTKVVDG